MATSPLSRGSHGGTHLVRWTLFADLHSSLVRVAQTRSRRPITCDVRERVGLPLGQRGFVSYPAAGDGWTGSVER